MDTRLAAVKSLIGILEQDKSYDEVVNSYVDKIDNLSELINLVSGAVKFKLKLDYFIDSVSTRSKISPPIRNILRAAVYELEFLKIPDYAVINSFVNIAKKYDKNSSGFVNAVLRSFLRQKEEIFAKIKEMPQIKAVSIEYSHHNWLIEKWAAAYGINETVKICEFNNKIPITSLRVNSLKASKREILDLFQENNIAFRESPICEDCLLLEKTGNIKQLPGFLDGLWTIQGEASSLVAKVLDPQANYRILDLCAAPGGKTTHIAALMHDSGEIIAVDSSKERIKKVIQNCERLSVNSVKTVVSDASIYSDSAKFDRVLVDAPCSNTGVFIKRPDARWKRKPEDIKSLSELQYKILENAAKLVKSGGIIVYSTCSIEPEENINIIQQFLAKNKAFRLQNISQYLPWEDEGQDGYVQILQSKHNIEGFFIAKLIKL